MDTQLLYFNASNLFRCKRGNSNRKACAIMLPQGAEWSQFPLCVYWGDSGRLR
jgi:hypothetical protein